MKKNGLQNWLKSNGWNMFAFFTAAVVASIIGFSGLERKALANEIAIKELQLDLAEYPSQDWFELKFSEIDKSISDLEVKLN